MAWIKTIPFDEADEDLKQLLMETRIAYPQEYEAPSENSSIVNESIVDTHTLIPGCTQARVCDFQ